MYEHGGRGLMRSFNNAEEKLSILNKNHLKKGERNKREVNCPPE